MVDGIVRHSHYGSSTVPYLNDHLALVRALHILLAWNQDVLSISVEGRQKTFRLKFTCKYKEPTKLFTLIILDKPACQLREGNFSAHPVPYHAPPTPPSPTTQTMKEIGYDSVSRVLETWDALRRCHKENFEKTFGKIWVDK